MPPVMSITAWADAWTRTSRAAYPAAAKRRQRDGRRATRPTGEGGGRLQLLQCPRSGLPS
jgi:hypothetical protein